MFKKQLQVVPLFFKLQLPAESKHNSCTQRQLFSVHLLAGERGADIQKMFLGRYPVSFYGDQGFFRTGTIF